MKTTVVFTAAIFMIGLSIGPFRFARADDVAHTYLQSYQFEDKQDYDNAIKVMVPLYDKFPAYYTLNLRFGWLYYLSGKHAHAQRYYRAAIAANAGSVEAQLGLTLPLLAEKNFSEVEKICRHIMETDPFNFLANLRLSKALMGQEKLKPAKRVLLKMLTLYPTNVDYLNQLGRVYRALGDKDAAHLVYNDLVILDPDNEGAREYFDSIRTM